MRIFASDRLSAIMGRLGMQEGEAIVSPMVTKAVARAQKRVEEQNFGSRKHLLEYDDVMNQQRQVIYSLRRAALEGETQINFLEDTVSTVAHGMVTEFSPEVSEAPRWQFDDVAKSIKTQLQIDVDYSELDPSEATVDGVAQVTSEQALTHYRKKVVGIGPENTQRLEAWIYLQVIDKAWKNHLLGMDSLKDSVSLRGYGQRDPLQEYKKEPFDCFLK